MLENQKQLLLISDLGIMFPKETSKHKKRYGLYLCHCGNEFKTITDNIKNGNTKSCGCSRISHGLRSHPLYSTLKNMIQRTSNHKDKDFSSYGRRGITICDEWKNNFMSFYNWAIVNGWEKGLSIDRINNDLGYSPDNCRFTTREVQARNTRVLRATNSSGHRGVSWDSASKKWRASIGVSSKNIRLGSFNTPIEASEAYINYVKENNLEHNYSIA